MIVDRRSTKMKELQGAIDLAQQPKAERVTTARSKKTEEGLGRRALSTGVHLVGDGLRWCVSTPTKRKVVASIGSAVAVAFAGNHYVVQPRNDQIARLKRDGLQASTKAERAKADAAAKAIIDTENALSRGANERLNATPAIPKQWSVTVGSNGMLLHVPCSTAVTAPNPETGADGDVSDTGSIPFRYKDTGAQEAVIFAYSKVGVWDANGQEHRPKAEPATMDLKKPDRVASFVQIIKDSGACQAEAKTTSSSTPGGGDQAAGGRKP